MSTSLRKNIAPECITDLIQFVERHSPYYGNFWSCFEGSKGTPKSLGDLPIVDHTSFWESNTCLDSKVLTSTQQDGIIFKTGGTTTNPKVSFYNHEELQSVARQLAECLRRCGVGEGDRVANLFYAGDLYGSFLLHILSIYHLPSGAIQIPIAGHVGLDVMESYIVEFQANVILATVTTLSKLAERALDENKTHPYVRKLLFSGETLYDDQVKLLKDAFPNATVQSLAYGSMECGLIGMPLETDGSAQDPRVHQVNLSTIVIEIINEDGQVITTPGEAGSLVVTNVERRLMPIIRYPSGDRAAWVNPALGLFRVLGRDRTGIRVGPVSVDFEDLRRVVTTAMQGQAVRGLQAVVSRGDHKDILTLVIAYTPKTEGDSARLRGAIAERLAMVRPPFKDHVNRGFINPLQIKFVTLQELAVNPRSGKNVEVLDTRSTAIHLI